jgi:hypothetical protein
MKIALCLTALVAVAASSVSGGSDFNGVNHFILCDPPCSNEESWIATGSPNVVRRAVETILLPDGKVLAAGGIGMYYRPLSSAELYDPGTGGWSFTGKMQLARAGNTVTLLPNQKVLVTGGLVPDFDFEFGVTRTAELYDPATGRWSVTGSMHMVRGGHTATLLQNGKVLVAGGSYDDVLDSAELYDPATETWSLTGSLLEGRTEHTATLLQDGKVLIAGGWLHFGAGNVSAGGALYDPSTGIESSGRHGHATRGAHGHRAAERQGPGCGGGQWQRGRFGGVDQCGDIRSRHRLVDSHRKPARSTREPHGNVAARRQCSDCRRTCWRQ